MSSYVAEKVRHLANNGVIRVANCSDPLALSLLRNEKVIESTVRVLKEDDPTFEILSDIDDLKEVTRKEIQERLGMSFSLAQVRDSMPTQYNRLKRFGGPTETLTVWGFNVIPIDRTTDVTVIRNRLHSLAKKHPEGRIVGLDRRSPSTYKWISRRAAIEGLSIKKYVKKLGFNYGKY